MKVIYSFSIHIFHPNHNFWDITDYSLSLSSPLAISLLRIFRGPTFSPSSLDLAALFFLNSSSSDSDLQFQNAKVYHHESGYGKNRQNLETMN